ncbi:MAG: GNAT family N-acetyltransferase, partial [Candidatus Binatia bacterium]
DSSDAARLEAFFRAIPEDDRTFFKEDISDPETLRSIVADARSLRLISLADGAIEGYVAVLPGIGLSSHVGEVRLLVVPPRRRSGVGRELARRALVGAVRELSLRKLFVEVVAEQEPAIRMFQKLGFVAEAILRDHLCDRARKMQDLVLLAHFVDETWAGMQGLGLDRELG